MLNKRAGKLALLSLILLFAAVILSGCVFTPEEINTQDPNQGNVPIPTIAVVTPTTAPQATVGQIVLITNQPTQQVIHFITPTPNVEPTVPMGATASPVPTFMTITATPAPTSSTLKLGSKGDAVKHVQTLLRSLGFYKGSLDGDFGEGTENAVKDFQRQYKLTIDGKVGPKTLSTLEGARATKKPDATPTKKPTATPKPTPKGTATPKASSYAKTYLRIGDSGSQVKKMQERLISLGYLSGKATGNFDGTTEKAVIAFQKRYCSYSDGVAGPDTLSILYSDKPRKTSTSSGTIGVTYRTGDKGDKVKAIQQQLKALGYYTGSADGDFGSGTADAVKAFQKRNGLTADGIVGDTTLTKMFSSGAVHAKQTATPKPTSKTTKKPTATPRHTATPPPNAYVRVTKSPTEKYVVLREGNWGEPVKQLQEALKAQGYFNGTVDGIYGEQTTQAVKLFQRAKKLSADGIAGFATQQVLFEGAFPDES